MGPFDRTGVQFVTMKKTLLFILLIVLGTGCEDLFLGQEPVNDPITNFEIFWESFDRQYSFFELKNIDWDSLHAVFRAKINPQTRPDQLFKILSELTLLLEDGHVSIFSRYGTSYYDFTRGY